MIGIDTFELNTGLKTAIDIADTIVYTFLLLSYGLDCRSWFKVFQ